MAVFLFGRSGGDSLSPVFSENSWDQIIKACQRNKVPATWLVGDYKDMLINGTWYQIDIIGKYHDLYSDGTGKAPLTLQFHDCYEMKYPIDSSETVHARWINSQMRSTHLPSILPLMPAEVQLGIRRVIKLAETADDITFERIADRIFLPSEEEIYGKNVYSVSEDGIQYDYYKNGGNKSKKLAGANTEWWTRSMYGTNSKIFVTVQGNGASGLANQYLPYSVSPAFCF